VPTGTSLDETLAFPPREALALRSRATSPLSAIEIIDKPRVKPKKRKLAFTVATHHRKTFALRELPERGPVQVLLLYLKDISTGQD